MHPIFQRRFLLHPARSIQLFNHPLIRHYHLSKLSLSQADLSSASDSTSSTASHPPPPPSVPITTYVPAPEPDSGPILTRIPNRALPNIEQPSRVWLKTLPIFLVILSGSALAIFNYQKSTSSTVNSILYALRTNETSLEILGDRIYFASKVPWIRGELNQLHGRIDLSFWVKGTRGMAKVRFVSVRKSRTGFVSCYPLTPCQ